MRRKLNSLAGTLEVTDSKDDASGQVRIATNTPEAPITHFDCVLCDSQPEGGLRVF